MQRELPTIDFPSQAEVWSKAEHRRTEEITDLVKLTFRGWAAKFRRKPTIAGAVRYMPASALAGNQRLPQGRA